MYYFYGLAQKKKTKFCAIKQTLEYFDPLPYLCTNHKNKNIPVFLAKIAGKNVYIHFVVPANNCHLKAFINQFTVTTIYIAHS